MLGMSQEPKLAQTVGCPFSKSGGLLAGSGGNIGEEPFLRLKGFGGQSGLLARAPEVGEVDVGGQVLLARFNQEGGTRAMVMVGPERALGPLRRKELVGPKAVIDGHEFSLAQSLGCVRPP